MANAGLNSAQRLPRFLLPRLSWRTSSSVHQNTIRALSTISSSHYTPSRSTNTPINRHISRPRHNANPQSKPGILQNPSHHRAFYATARQSRDHHFDTLKFVQRLQEEGFTEAQSVAMMKVLSDVIEERYTNCSTPPEVS